KAADRRGQCRRHRLPARRADAALVAMNLLIPLAGLLGIEVESITERVRNAVIVNAVMIVLGVAGIGFLLAAGVMALADIVGGIYAALIFAAAFLVITLAVYLGTRVGESRRRREVATKRRSS